MRRREAVAVIVLMVPLVGAGCSRIDNSPEGSPTYVDPASQPLPGSGIDSKEMRAAADRMARSIMNTPKIVASHSIPRIVLDERYFRNDSSQIVDKGLFSDHLRVSLQQVSDGRFEVLGRSYDDMVEDEREAEIAGEVTGGAVVAESPRLGWDYRLGGAIRSIAKIDADNGQRSTYFLITFELVERGTGRIAWSDRYEFKKWEGGLGTSYR